MYACASRRQSQWSQKDPGNIGQMGPVSGEGEQGRGAVAEEAVNLSMFSGAVLRAELKAAVDVQGPLHVWGRMAHRTLCTECRESSCAFLP